MAIEMFERSIRADYFSYFPCNQMQHVFSVSIYENNYQLIIEMASLLLGR